MSKTAGQICLISLRKSNSRSTRESEGCRKSFGGSDIGPPSEEARRSRDGLPTNCHRARRAQPRCRVMLAWSAPATTPSGRRKNCPQTGGLRLVHPDPAARRWLGAPTTFVPLGRIAGASSSRLTLETAVQKSAERLGSSIGAALRPVFGTAEQFQKGAVRPLEIAIREALVHGRPRRPVG